MLHYVFFYMSVVCFDFYILFHVCCVLSFFFFQAEDGIRDAQESRGLGDVYKRQSVKDLTEHLNPGNS